MLSQRGKPLLVHDGHSFGIQYVRKDKKYWQCNLSRKYNCKARVTTTDMGEIIVTNNEHCHTEIRQHLRKDYRHLKIHQNFAMQQRHFFFNPNAAAVAAGKMEPMFLNAAPSMKIDPPVYQNNNNSSVGSNNGQNTPSNESTSGGGSPRNNDGEQD
jgi:FLYWCH zinc finger domain